MNTQTLFPSVAAVAFTLLLTGCGNPAENVTPAEVGEASSAAATTGHAIVSGTPHVITPASRIDFVGSKVTGSHDGGFSTFTGQLMMDAGELVAAGSSVEIDMTSTWSDSDRLTNHLKSPDFFDVETFATTTFTFTEVVTGGEGTTTITGDLTLHGVTRQISFPATVTAREGAVELDAEFYLKRFDFEIVYPGKADDLIRDEVVIRLAVTAEA